MTVGQEHLDDAVWRTRLPDGPIVLTEAMVSVRSVAVGFWIRQGTAHEDPCHRGISHLLEHMVFKGTERRTAARIAQEIEALGGSLDAFTTHEYTSYQARIPHQHLDRAMDVLVDLVFHPKLDEHDLRLEREVVLEELARVEDTPEDRVFDLHAAHLYGDHPYGASILGSRESLGAIDCAALRAVHTRAYVPQNLVVCVAGFVDHTIVVENLLRMLPQVTGSTPPDIPTPAGLSSESLCVRGSEGRQAHIVMGGGGVAQQDPLRYSVVVVGTALGAGMSSRLFQRIREDLGLAYSVFSYHSFLERGGHVGAYAGTRLETLSETADAMRGELRVLAEGGLKAPEAEAAKEQVKGQLMMSFESTTARMNHLASSALHHEPYRSLEYVTQRIDSVTNEELNRAAALFHPDRLAVLELLPA